MPRLPQRGSPKFTRKEKLPIKKIAKMQAKNSIRVCAPLLAQKDEIFYLVFAAVVADPQLIECSDGLYENWEVGSRKTRTRRSWRIFPVHWNRNMWRQFSHHLRFKRRHNKNLSCHDFLWMNVRQLQLAKILMTEFLGISDTSAVDRLLAYKKEEMFP